MPVRPVREMHAASSVEPAVVPAGGGSGLRRILLNRYSVALLASLVTILLMEQFRFFLARMPLLVPLFAVIVACAYGGFGPGVLATVVLETAATLILRSLGVSVLQDPVERFRFGAGGIAAIGMCAVGGAVREHRFRAARREAALRGSESRYRTLLEQASDGIFVADLSGRFVTVNSRACEMLGYTSDELLSMRVDDILSPESLASQPVRWEELRTAPRVLFEREMVRKDGSRLMVEVSARLTPDGHAQAIARDITERHLAQAALRASETELRSVEHQLRQAQKMEAVGRLASGVAHDFNNLLTIIMGNAELALVRVPVNDPGRAAIHEVTLAAQRGAALTRQLLAFSRKQVMQPRELDLNETVREIEKMLGRLIGEDVSLITHCDPGLGRVQADPGQIEQVILNLAVNARDAMPEGGAVTITTQNVSVESPLTFDQAGLAAGEYVMLSIGDTGCGMDEETQARMFEPFFTTKPLGKGTGLGLAVVDGIVEQSGGTIRVESAVGRGTSFHIYFPRLPNTSELQATPASARAVATPMLPAHGTVLLVEDEDMVRHLARRILEREGYPVVEAGTGADAVAASARIGGRVDLLVTDMVMPGMTGRELADRLAMRWPDLRVLYLSGYVSHEVQRLEVPDARRAFLPKPFSAADLTRAVSEIMRREGSQESAPS